MAYRSVVDPWFNFRATKYLVQNGFYSFWDWFDDRTYSLHYPQAVPLPVVPISDSTDEQEHGIRWAASLEAPFTPA